MKIVKKYLKSLQYYPGEFPKKQIFLHHTSGSSALSALSWWDQTPDHIGCAYLIERDGTIIEAFEPERWAYHLGANSSALEKSSIGIELVSRGRLFKEGENYIFYPALPLKKLPKIVPPDQVEILKSPWKDFLYYEKYTDDQILALLELLDHLIGKFNIKVQDDISDFLEYNPLIISQGLNGIWAHTSVRKDKSDLFPQPSLIEALTDHFPPKI
jgi:N-acetyl-anhydromuramyl-L-alanine amidase AmpD